MKLLSIDPGETTGYVIVDTETKKILRRGEVNYKHASISIRMAVEQLSETDLVINESFQIRSGHAGAAQKDMKASQVIGMIKVAVKDRGCEHVEQPPHVRTRINNGVLTDAGYDLKDLPGPHIKDALRHAVRWMRKHDEKWHHKLQIKEAKRIGLI